MSEMQILANEEIKQTEITQNRQVEMKEEKNPQELQEQTTIQYVRPQSLNQYLHQDTVRKTTDTKLKQLNLQEHKTSLEHGLHQENIHIKTYCKLLRHLLRLEYHFFDHNWFPNINHLDPTNMVDIRELSYIPGRAERTLQRMHPRDFKKKLEHEHVKIYLEHH
jgi:hypothetical protein